MVTCKERADHLALVCDVKLCICHFSIHKGKSLTCWVSLVCDVLLYFCSFPMKCPGQVWYLIVSIPDPLLLHCTKEYALSSILFFMILLENVVIRQRSNFIQFIHISFKDPQFISSDL